MTSIWYERPNGPDEEALVIGGHGGTTLGMAALSRPLGERLHWTPGHSRWQAAPSDSPGTGLAGIGHAPIREDSLYAKQMPDRVVIPGKTRGKHLASLSSAERLSA